MDLSRALGQLADIHQQIAKAEVYRGYRSLPIAASGLMGFAAAWAQTRSLGASDPVGFVVYWLFFSSRRRHTRFSRDWSSDVCSSDLRGAGARGDRRRRGPAERPGPR